MTNPLTDRTAAANSRILMAGDERTITTKSGDAITVIRSSRPYVFDLCDAYNAANRREEIEWRVDAAGALKLGYRADWSRQNARLQEQRRETESARALQRSFEDMR